MSSELESCASFSASSFFPVSAKADLRNLTFINFWFLSWVFNSSTTASIPDLPTWSVGSIEVASAFVSCLFMSISPLVSVRICQVQVILSPAHCSCLQEVSAVLWVLFFQRSVFHYPIQQLPLSEYPFQHEWLLSPQPQALLRTLPPGIQHTVLFA